MLIWFNEYTLTDQSTINNCCGWNIHDIGHFTQMGKFEKFYCENFPQNKYFSQHMIVRLTWVVLSRDTQILTKLDYLHATILPVILWAIKFTNVENQPVAVFSAQIQAIRRFVTSTNQLIQIKFIRASSICVLNPSSIILRFFFL